MYEKPFERGHFLAFAYREKAELAPHWAARVVRDGMDKTAPKEVIGDILDAGQDPKTEILDKELK